LSGAIDEDAKRAGHMAMQTASAGDAPSQVGAILIDVAQGPTIRTSSAASRGRATCSRHAGRSFCATVPRRGARTVESEIAGSLIAPVSPRRRAFRHSRAPIRKGADHAIYTRDHIVSLVGPRPPYLVHNGRIDSYFARRCACGCGGSVASGTPRHRIEFQAH